MGGFLSALSGAGQAAGEYGHQVRQHLEARRGELSDALGKAAEEESDPQTRLAMLNHRADLLAGKPMGGIVQGFAKTLQNRIKDNHALNGVIGPIDEPKAQTSAPGPAGAGAMPGMAQIIPPVQADAPPPQGISGFMHTLLAGKKKNDVQVGDSMPQATPQQLQQQAQRDQHNKPRIVPAEKDQIKGIHGDGIPGWPSYGPTAVDSSIKFDGGGDGTPEASAQPPQPASAAQPNSNPISKPTAPIGGVPGAPSAPQAQPPIQPVAGASAAASPASAAAPDYTTPEDPNAIMQATMSNPLWSAPANRPLLLQGAQQRLSHQEALRQTMATRQMDLGERQKALTQLENSPEWAGIPSVMKVQYRLWAHSLAAQVPQIAPALMNPVNTPGSIPSDAIEDADRVDKNNKPIDSATNPYVREHTNKLTGRTYYSPTIGPVQTVAGADGSLNNVAKLPGKLTTDNGDGAAQPLSNLNYRATGVDAQGHPTFNSISRMNSGIAGVTGEGTAPAMLPSTSVQSTPGSLPTTTVKTRGGAPAARSAIQPVGGAGGAGASASASSSARATEAPPNDTIAGYVDDIKTGKAALNSIPAKERNAVRQYMNRNKIDVPTPESAAAQKSVGAIDPVVKEVNDLLSQLDKVKDDKYLGAEYVKYKLGRHTDYDNLFTGLSFEGLRSASAALQGMNSRAYPIISRALDHTPQLERLHGLMPDSIPLMKDKLKSVLKILQDGRQSALDDGKKSGVIGPVDGAPAPGGSANDPMGIR